VWEANKLSLYGVFSKVYRLEMEKFSPTGITRKTQEKQGLCQFFFSNLSLMNP